MAQSRSKLTTRCLALAAVGLTVGGCQPDDSAGAISESGAAVDSPTQTEANALTGENLGGTNLGGANLGGANLGGTNLGGANLGGTNLGGANLGGANLGGTNLGGANLGGNNLAGTNLAGANLAGSNLAGSNLAGANLAGSNLGGSNLAGANLAGSNLAGTNLGGANLSAANIGKDIHSVDENKATVTGAWFQQSNVQAINGGFKFITQAGSLVIPFKGIGATVAALKCVNCGKMNIKVDGVLKATVDLYSPTDVWRADVYTTGILTNANHTVTVEWTGTKNPASTNTTVTFDALRVDRGGTKLLRSGEDIFHADLKATPSADSSCAVMGIGSTAFTRLVNANAGANMYALLEKLPWGFASVSGGAQQLEAWEAVVWGSNTYCVFVVPAPVGTTYEGVRGFLKAVFRWNAPPSKSMTIGKIGGGTALATYTGMMNAGAKFANGTLAENVLVAGLISFTTATTNNVAVNVDFASWVKLKDGTYAVLGNPTVTGGAQYNEGTYSSSSTPDGSIRVMVTHNSIYGPYNGNLNSAYLDYQRGLRTKPMPKRCVGWKHLYNVFGEPVPSGKCDTGVDFLTGHSSCTGYAWMTMSGAQSNTLTNTLYYPQIIPVTLPGETVVTDLKPMAATQIFVNETPF